MAVTFWLLLSARYFKPVRQVAPVNGKHHATQQKRPGDVHCLSERQSMHYAQCTWALAHPRSQPEGHMVSADIWGQCHQRVPGAEPLVKESGASPLKPKVFLPICPKICFFVEQKNSSDVLGPWPLDPLNPPLELI